MPYPGTDYGGKLRNQVGFEEDRGRDDPGRISRQGGELKGLVRASPGRIAGHTEGRDVGGAAPDQAEGAAYAKERLAQYAESGSRSA